MFSIEELVTGKPYACFLKRDRRKFKLLWGPSKEEMAGQARGSIFIFLDVIFLGKVKNIFTIKGLVNGKLLYAPGCDRAEFYFEEIK